MYCILIKKRNSVKHRINVLKRLRFCYPTNSIEYDTITSRLSYVEAILIDLIDLLN